MKYIYIQRCIFSIDNGPFLYEIICYIEFLGFRDDCTLEMKLFFHPDILFLFRTNQCFVLFIGPIC